MDNEPRDGYMPECNPTTCPKNCCKSKEVFYVDEEHPLSVRAIKNPAPGKDAFEMIGSKIAYNALITSAEAAKLLLQSEKYGIRVIKKNMVDQANVNPRTGEFTPVTVWMLIGCLQDHGCGLDIHDKPDVCTCYPFKLNSDMRKYVDTSECPKAIEIASNPQTLEEIIKIRTRLGYTDNDRYRIMIHFMQTTSPIYLP